MDRRRPSGFTLVELVVALAVAAVLLGVGVPSFTGAIQNSRIGTQYNQVTRALFLARSEAVKSGEFVVVCARSAPESGQCGDENDWGNGWLVFVDVDSNVAAPAKVEAGDTIIATEPAVTGGNTVHALASLASGSAAEAVAHVRYRPRGDTDWQGGSIVVCDAERGEEHSRAINVKLTGSIQPGRPSGTERIPRDAFGSPIVCGTSA